MIKFQMYKILILASILLFTGCSQKINIHAKPTDLLHEKTLTQTRKVKMSSGEQIKAFIVATYINQIEHELVIGDEVERFIVSIYIPSGQRQELYDEIQFIVNGEIKSSAVRMKNSDPLLKLLPAPNPWSKNYLLEAPRDKKSRTATLSFKTPKYTSRVVSFTRDYL